MKALHPLGGASVSLGLPPQHLDEREPLEIMATRDPTFERWKLDGLQWLPDRGMGYYPVREQPYDAAYWKKYARYADTELGRQLTAARVGLLERYVEPGGSVVVDVGIGSGQFVEAVSAAGFNALGYDVNPVAVDWLEGRGRFWDPRRTPCEVLTFWDSLEHIQDAAAYGAGAREWVFCSLPLVPGDGPPPRGWKHFRTDEHCWYWTRAGLIGWMAEQGFRCVEHNTMESLLGREDISTFAFRRQR